MKTKICTQCGVEKEVSEFSTCSAVKSGLRSCCKDCQSKTFKRFYKNNLDNEKLRHKDYYQSHPWQRTYDNIMTRCENINSKSYISYGGRGIKCQITANELKEIWLRDKAYEMIEPSIDRFDNNGNYAFDNCRYIELDINRRYQRSTRTTTLKRNNK